LKLIDITSSIIVESSKLSNPANALRLKALSILKQPVNRLRSNDTQNLLPVIEKEFGDINNNILKPIDEAIESGDQFNMRARFSIIAKQVIMKLMSSGKFIADEENKTSIRNNVRKLLALHIIYKYWPESEYEAAITLFKYNINRFFELTYNYAEVEVLGKQAKKRSQEFLQKRREKKQAEKGKHNEK